MEKEYTMYDIKKFLIDYRNSLTAKPKGIVAAIPIVGTRMTQTAALEEQKRVFFEKEYNKVIKEGIERQKRFILQMTPVLNDFYSEKKDNKK